MAWLAVIAAAVAFLGVGRNVRAQREAHRKEQWWERARWALELLLSEDHAVRMTGLEVLRALAQGEFSREHETEFVRAAIDMTLPALNEELPPQESTDSHASDQPEADLFPRDPTQQAGD